MMDFKELLDIVEACSYKPGWSINILCGQNRYYVQLKISVLAEASRDSRTDARSPWKSAKRYLSSHMCRQEVVGIVFGLIKDAEMHEVHEWFRYKGASIYNPHLDPEVLVNIARKASSFNTRENAMSMDEPNGLA